MDLEKIQSFCEDYINSFYELESCKDKEVSVACHNFNDKRYRIIFFFYDDIFSFNIEKSICNEENLEKLIDKYVNLCRDYDLFGLYNI